MANKLEDDVRIAFDRAIEVAASSRSSKNNRSGAISPEELLTAVRILVRNLKADGRPPENVVVTVKDLCGLSRMTIASDTDSSLDMSDTKKLSDMVVRTAIDEYYTGTRLIGQRPWKGYSSELEDVISS
ncbi:MAG TPA: hypothetical protein VK481_10935 [Gemmatimonadaceae bacterium]|nr:hypothetical protein [Gemmatimonadaceae bacterium]